MLAMLGRVGGPCTEKASLDPSGDHDGAVIGPTPVNGSDSVRWFVPSASMSAS